MTSWTTINPDYSTTRMVTMAPPKLPDEMAHGVGSMLQLPPDPQRLAEGGLRVCGYFKASHAGKPLVTIITVVYNGAEYLEQSIQSVINQGYENVEYIIIDGGSTDGTVNIIRKYEHMIDYWVSEPDKGISDAFNKGVMVSLGDYINFQGSDDYFCADDVIERTMEGVDVANHMLVCGKIERVANTKEKKVLWVSPSRFKKHFNRHALLMRMPLPHQGLFMHKNYFKEYGVFDVNCKFSMDYELLLRSYKNFPTVLLKDVLVSAWRDGGIGTGRTKEVLREFDRIKVKNKVAPRWVLWLINNWVFFKYWIKTILNSFFGKIKNVY